MAPVTPHPFFAGLPPVALAAHRGGAGLRPENTLEAFTTAVREFRADILELDVHASSDGQVVVSHDPSTGRCADQDLPIGETRWPLLSRLDAGFRFTPDGAAFPYRGRGVVLCTLPQLLGALPQARLIIDAKAPAVLGPLVDALVSAGATQRVCIGSENDEVAGALFRALPDACHFFPANAAAAFVFNQENDPRFAALALPAVWQGAFVPSATLRANATKHHKWLAFWTVNDPTEMRECVSLGADGLVTDRPDRFRTTFG